MTGNSQKGQSLVFVAAGLVVILGAMGLAIDMGYLRYMKRQMQTAADAAAVAAAGEIDYGDFNVAGLNAASKNNFTNGGANGTTVTIYHPPQAPDPHSGSSFFVQSKITYNAPTFFAKIFGISTIPMTVTSVAAESGGTNCIFALAPSGAGLSVVALATVTSQCGIVVESSSTNAITCALLAAINASSIGVVGNVGSFLCTITPTPKKIKLPVPADPLAAWAAANAPPVPACGVTTSSPYNGAPAKVNVTGPLGTTFFPGVYCGGIQLSPGANVTFFAGTYILKSTNTAGASIPSYGLTVDLGTKAKVQAYNGSDGVTFYNPGPGGGFNFVFAGTFTAGQGVILTAPTSGQYEGMLFFQPSSNTNAAQIIGSSTYSTKLEGTYYLPAAAVNFAFSGPVNYNILVAKTINFFIFTFGGGQISGAAFNKDYTSLADGSPIKGGYGVLIE